MTPKRREASHESDDVGGGIHNHRQGTETVVAGGGKRPDTEGDADLRVLDSVPPSPLRSSKQHPTQTSLALSGASDRLIEIMVQRTKVEGRFTTSPAGPSVLIRT